ncbi:MAG TPA: hypothetical protein PKC45_09800 [Gemmatales bacterium]|nr:hypothetical protein [Gemmatales bacterium]
MSERRVVIDLEELHREVTEMQLAVERDRNRQNPEQRIVEILDLMRRYMGAVVRANAPRDFSPGLRDDGKQRASLRGHREDCLDNMDERTGLEPLRGKLTSLDCTFVLAGEGEWRLDEQEWEMKLWRPLCRWVESGYLMLYDGMEQQEWPKYVQDARVKEWCSEEQEIEYLLFSRIALFIPYDEFPVVNEKDFTLRWRGKTGLIGDNDSFQILKYLMKHRSIHYDQVCMVLCNDGMTTDAIRQAISRMKKRLRAAGCSELADCILPPKSGIIRVEFPPFEATIPVR